MKTLPNQVKLNIVTANSLIYSRNIKDNTSRLYLDFLQLPRVRDSVRSIWMRLDTQMGVKPLWPPKKISSSFSRFWDPMNNLYTRTKVLEDILMQSIFRYKQQNIPEYSLKNGLTTRCVLFLICTLYIWLFIKPGLIITLSLRHILLINLSFKQMLLKKEVPTHASWF